jgi:hypothetical protein
MWRIDTSGARGYAGLDRALCVMQRTLSDPQFVKALCVHETAHEVYWRKLGYTTTPDYNITFEYDKILDRELPVYASILHTGQPLPQTSLLDIAKAHACGAVAAHDRSRLKLPHRVPATVVSHHQN